MRRKLLIALLATMFFSCIGISTAGATSSFEDTDLLSIWRVSSTGYIYTPVSIYTKATIYYTVNSPNYNVTKREVYSRVLRSVYDNYPSAQFGPNKLVIRGGTVIIPTKGSYMDNVSFFWDGYYNDTPTTYPISSTGSGYGQTKFIAGVGGYQPGDSTTQVDFTW